MNPPGALDHAVHTPYSEPGIHAGRIAEVPTDPSELGAVARNVIVHYRASGHELPAATRHEIDSRWMDRILAADQQRHPWPLAEPREVTDRVQGCCRDHTLFCVSVLRAHGIPARSRVGFAGYFTPGWHHDHVIVEAWLAGRWQSFDAEVDAPWPALPAPLDMTLRDLEGTGFATAAGVWSAYRDGDLDPDTYGVDPNVPGLRGRRFLFDEVIYEIAHRFGDELLLWDGWGRITGPGAELTEEDAVWLDGVAELLLAADDGDVDAEAGALSRYRSDAGLHPGPTIVQASPFGDPPVEITLAAKLTLVSDDAATPAGDPWPTLPLAEWAPTRDTLQLWTQVVGKVRMERTPVMSHWWNVPLYVTARGLTTSLVPAGGRAFQIDFDLLDHRLDVIVSDGQRRAVELAPKTTARFFVELTNALDELGLATPVWTMPVEIAGAIPFDRDEQHRSYDAGQVERFWRLLVQADRVFEVFRSRFVGKVSPVHLFWGALDLAVTRFSGRQAPPHPGGAPNCGPHVMHEAYSHEVSSAGYWPGPDGEGVFYSYAYPQPDGFADADLGVPGASWDGALGEFVLPYTTVRTALDPDALLVGFLQASYEAAADLGAWDRAGLERA